MLHAVVAVLAGAACSDSTTAPVTTWTATLNVANETPAPTGTTDLGGTATVNATGGGTAAGSIVYSMTLTGTPTSALSAAHIHAGTSTGGATLAGTGGGIVRVVLCLTPVVAPAPACPAGAGTVPSTTITYTSGSTAVLGSPAMTFDGLVTALRNYGAYVNVHTSTNGGGETRGQLIPTVP